ncbi:D-alanyl-D-alanine carboxypeptidase family protein [Lentzea sp. NBC_00516]|uniref:D-alanyl-D-alanine carboxypeptidase family protein n=1 Tax=Lentzea sp. NBC_00516 TaxID=2903582 RepID=UPI002E823024|nr:D-alanyl-D-alanine carboxypeptidase family protein [Lentzea sp. NBC_00516]WUD28091.1 D-alanyl-D-alanine carboxypeptidase family protein [Lentzea sp. NBC_00516]
MDVALDTFTETQLPTDCYGLLTDAVARGRIIRIMSKTSRRVVFGVLLIVTLVVSAGGALGYLGRLTLVFDRHPGKPLAIVEEVPGPPDGPNCSIDARYFDEEPRGLRPEVLKAWLALRAKASEQGVKLCLNDGKRSRQQQQAEFDEAVKKFGTEELASKYVLNPPDRSMHVIGFAVDIQPIESAKWVENNGSSLGWCRRYENEQWHFEYNAGYPTGGCPALIPSATGS